MPAREREHGELPSPDLSLSDRKVGQGLFVFRIVSFFLLVLVIERLLIEDDVARAWSSEALIHFFYGLTMTLIALRSSIAR